MSMPSDRRAAVCTISHESTCRSGLGEPLVYARA
jgi:hypothetical protein